MALFLFLQEVAILLSQNLPSPKEIKELLPKSAYVKDYIDNVRAIAKNIVLGKDKRIALIIGPCSIHDIDSALEYAAKLKTLSDKVSEHFYIVMRVFIEKPRTKIGWKGLIHDPHLDGTNDIEKGIMLSRKLLLHLTHLGLPCAIEFVDPLFAPYIEDLVTWGFVGARTSASQPHRQMASGLSFPVGFKNQVDGNIDIAIDGVINATSRHSHLSIDPSGRVAKITTPGNPLAHLVLRGSDARANYDPISVSDVLSKLHKQDIKSRILIDCSHGNSNKKAELQKLSFSSIIDQILDGNNHIMGLMLESFLYSGKQALHEEPEKLSYGVSITDSCLGWKETEELIEWASLLFSTPKPEEFSLSTSMSSVQS